ncbi:MAG: hypothetical protein KDD35_01390 [Bdellovibrionales bacterium]|nr:hypothetical protein [Bdellovibrionales bacterium]
MVEFTQYLEDQQKSLVTPCYIFSKKIIFQQILKLKELLPDGIELLYSLKANSNIEILRCIEPHVDGFDVSSRGELEKLLRRVSTSKYLSYVGVGKTLFDITFALERFNNLVVVVESIEEFVEVSTWAKELGNRIKILLRLQLSEVYLASGRKLNNRFSQFGIHQNEVMAHFGNLMDNPNIELLGFHYHPGSNFLDPQLIISNLNILFNFVELIRQRFGYRPEQLNLGGGFGIPYFSGQSPFDLFQFGEALKGELSTRSEDIFGSAKLIFELGRFVLGPAGCFVSRVLRTKVVNQKKIVVMDGGFSQNLALVGFDQIIKKSAPLKVWARSTGDLERVSLVGPSCYSADVWAEDIYLPKLDVGDLIYVPNSGAYGKAFSPTSFLCGVVPEEVLI